MTGEKLEALKCMAKSARLGLLRSFGKAKGGNKKNGKPFLDNAVNTQGKP
jgi:hypothetical protein